LFAPGVSDRELIGKLVKTVAVPVNILLSPGCPTITELEKIGVARVSAGSAVMRATLGLVRRIGAELLEKGTYASLMEGAIPWNEINELMALSGSRAVESAHS
jgi:2-methylisocitrate lyase-like PEP mutase family enzyme